MSAQKGSAVTRRLARQTAFDPKTRHPRAFALALSGMAIGLGAFLTPIVFVGLTQSLVEALEIVGITLLAAGLVTLVVASGALHPWRQRSSTPESWRFPLDLNSRVPPRSARTAGM